MSLVLPPELETQLAVVAAQRGLTPKNTQQEYRTQLTPYSIH